MINMVYSLAPRSFLFIVTKRQLPYGKAYLMKKIRQSVDRLKEHDEAHGEAAKRRGSRRSERRRVPETAGQDGSIEETKEESKQTPVRNNNLNRSHTVDKLVFKEDIKANYRPTFTHRT